MKYTSQIINGNVNIESLVSQNKYLKPISIVFALWVALMGLIIFTGAGTMRGLMCWRENFILNLNVY